MRIAAAAALYFAAVFGVGFLLGPIRVLWLKPRVGPIIAVACEAPFHLAAMVGAVRWIVARVQLEQDAVTRQAFPRSGRSLCRNKGQRMLALRSKLVRATSGNSREA